LTWPKKGGKLPCMPDNNITIEMTEKQLATAISGLLFSCSVNVVSNVNEEYQRELLDLACLLKTVRPDIKLQDIQFLKEDNYEDSLSQSILEEFRPNLEILTFDQV